MKHYQIIYAKCVVCGVSNTRYTPVRKVPDPFDLAFGNVKKVRLCDSCRTDKMADAVFAVGLL